MRRSGTSANAVSALFSHFCYVGGFGDLNDPVVPTLRGVSGDVVTVCAYYDSEGRFLLFVALPRAGQMPMAVSTNNGLVNGPVRNLLMHFFTVGSSKMEVFEPYILDIVTT